ncbi:MAG TPA: SBBP repeat-containing protein [Bryobacteraceae bacterium]|nr:SBBP repeat-containing protein [Bryobacteraceae bacterium]
MFAKLSLWFALLSATTAMAAQDFLLGVNYSELIPTGSVTTPNTPFQVGAGTDSQGAVYLLVNGNLVAQSIANVSYLMKLTPAGDRVVYQNALAFQAAFMAVDPAGNVYLAGSDFVQKLGADGATVLYTTTIGQNLTPTGLAADTTGRAYVTGWSSGSGFQTTPGALQQTPPSSAGGQDAFVVRLKPSGAIDYATYLGGGSQAQPAGIAVDAAGSAYITGFAFSANFPVTAGAYLAASGIPNSGASFLVRLSPDGSTPIYSTFTDAQDDHAIAVAVDSADNAVVLLSNAAYSASVVLRFNPQGTTQLFSTSLPASHPDGLAVDAAGNTYLASPTGANYPVKNSLAACDANGSSALTVLDGNGNVLQATYIPGSQGYSSPPAVGLGVNSTVYVVASPTASYAPTRQLAGSQPGVLFLTSFAQGAKAQVVPLACLGNAASYDSTGIAGGEMVSLFGQSLGPANGVQPQVDVQTGLPKQLGGVDVTFNGIAAPLLYVQGGQVNAIAPWSLQTSQTVQVCVVYNSAASNCLERTVVAADPGVFTVDGSNAAALNQDGSLNSASNPAQVGSTVTVFATGLGAIDPPQTDGAIVDLPLPANVLPVQVFWRGPTFFGLFPMNLAVNYAGPAPYEAAGVSQIDFVVQNSADEPLYLVVGFAPADVGGAYSAGFQVYIAQQ